MTRSAENLQPSPDNNLKPWWADTPYGRAMARQQRLFRAQKDAILRIQTAGIDLVEKQVNTVLDLHKIALDGVAQRKKSAWEASWPTDKVEQEKQAGIPEVVRGKNPADAYKAIAREIAGIKPGEFISFQRDFGPEGKPFVCRVDLYPKGVVARKDIPVKLARRKATGGGLSLRWVPDVAEYSKINSPEGTGVIGEIVGLDMSLPDNDHVFRFFNTNYANNDKRRLSYLTNALERYTSSKDTIMLIRNQETQRLLGIRAGLTDPKDKTVAEASIELIPDEDVRRRGIASQTMVDLGEILAHSGKIDTIVGSYLYGDYKNQRCRELWEKKKRQQEDGNTPWEKLKVGIDPEDPQIRKFEIGLKKPGL